MNFGTIAGLNKSVATAAIDKEKGSKAQQQ
jgi:hypothetical protein